MIKPICKIISEFYEIYNYYTLDEIIDKVNDLTDTSEIIIYHSLNHMIEDKVIVWNKNEMPGTLVNINKYYIFQPIKNSDITLPLSERLVYKENKNETLKLDIYKYFEVELKGNETYSCFEDYSNIHYRIYTELQKAFIKAWRTPQKNIQYGEVVGLKSQNKNKYGPFKAFIFKSKTTITLSMLQKLQDIYSNYDLVRYLIPDINNQNYIDHVIDKMIYSEKETILKNIIQNVIKNNYKNPSDKYDNYVYSFFKNNLIRYDTNNGYTILDDSIKDIVGFFLLNTKKSFRDSVNTNLENFTFYIFNSDIDEWILIDEVGKLNIKDNFKSSKKIKEFNTPPLWGYSYKNKEKHQFKIIRPSQRGSKDKLPGKVLDDVLGFKSISLLEIYKDVFEDYFEAYEGFILNLLDSSKDKVDKDNKKKYLNIDDETKLCSELYNMANKYFVRYPDYKNIIDKEFLVLYEIYYERYNYKNKSNHYLPYDLFLLKFNI